MKNVLLIILLCVGVNLYSQNNNDEYRKLIDSSIAIKSMETYKGFKEDLEKTNDTDNWKQYINNYKHSIENIYLIDNNNHPYFITLYKSNDIKFKQIDIYHPKNKKLIKKGIDAWKIIPTLDGNRLKIVIVDFKITYNKNNYQFSNGGGSTFVYEYSCENRIWKLISSKHSGI